MDPAVLYNGWLTSDFARAQRWERYRLAIVAGRELETLAPYRAKGLLVLRYTANGDEARDEKIDDPRCDGLFLDHSTAPVELLTGLATRLHARSKLLAVNTGWGANTREDFGPADLLLVESFLGTHTGDEGKWPVLYSRTDPARDLQRLHRLRARGYPVIALTFGPRQDTALARSSMAAAASGGARYFIYQQVPGWEMPGADFAFLDPAVIVNPTHEESILRPGDP